MDPNDAGIFDVIEHEERVDVPPAPEPKQKPAEEPKEVPEPKTNTEEVAKPAEAPTETETPKPAETTETETTETTEPSKTETQTPPATPETDWRTTLPPPPQPYSGPVPEVDENGQLTNMTAQEYAQYIKDSTSAEWRQEMYNQHVQNRALDAAEQVLPEIKTNPAVRQMVENAQIASVIHGQQIDPVEAARQVKELIGSARAEGAQNTKASITIQKNAALETGAGQKASEKTPVDKLDKRLKAGDNEAFVELFDIWSEEGKV